MLYQHLDTAHLEVRNLVWIAGGEMEDEPIRRAPATSDATSPQPSEVERYATVQQSGGAVAIGRPTKVTDTNTDTGMIDVVTAIPMSCRYSLQFFAFNELAALTRAALFDAWIFSLQAKTAMMARGLHHYELAEVRDVTGIEDQAGAREQDRADREWTLGLTLIHRTEDYPVVDTNEDLCLYSLQPSEVAQYLIDNPMEARYGSA